MSRRWPLLFPPLLLLSVLNVDSLNLDFNNVIKFGGRGYNKINFGASVVLHKDAGVGSALFGAPNDFDDGELVTGSVYRCFLNDTRCEKVLFGKRSWASLAGRRVELKAENMSYGMSMAYDFQNQHVSVCAPRRTLSWLNGPDAKKDLHYFTVGSCHAYDRNLQPFTSMLAESDLQRAEDLNDQDKSKVLHHINSMRELGFSIAVKNGAYVIGAPGYQDWSGKSVYFGKAEEPYPYSTTPVEMRDSADYAGYSVEHITINKTKYIVHGAPRRNNVKGGVIIALAGATHNSKSNIYISGFQTGEYFGAAVAVADVNGDGFDDLLVGAPFNSPTEEVRDKFGTVTMKLSTDTFDRGAVYVFLGKESELDQNPTILLPDAKSNGGRFGSVITNLGDVDKDGCDDIAVGAPFEILKNRNSTGAFYIFRGNAKNGLNNENRERITPPIGADYVYGFGYSISKGLDITGNKYLDFAVGAVISGHGFVYRSRPVVIIHANMTSPDKAVPREGGNCFINGRKDLYCFDLSICIAYEHPKLDEQSKIDDLFIQLDITADAKSSFPRALVSDFHNRVAANTATRTLRLRAPGKAECIDVKAFVLPAPLGQDLLNSIEFRLTYSIDESNKSAAEFCSDCPILYSKKPVSAYTGYQVNCKHEGCRVYLGLRAHVEGIENGQTIALGRTEPLNLIIDVDSAASSDIAYRTEVVIVLKSGLTFNNPDKCTRIDGNKEAIACLLGNELNGGQARSLTLKLQLETPAAVESHLAEIDVFVRTASKDQNADANRKQLSFPVEFRADVGVSGSGLTENVIFTKNASTINIDHIYTVTKYLKSLVDMVELVVNVPVSLKNDHLVRFPFNKVFSAEPRTSEVGMKLECTSEGLMKYRRGKREESKPQSASLQLPKDSMKQLVIDCSTFTCRTYKCRLGSFRSEQTRVTLHLQMSLNITHLIDLVKAIPEQIVYRSDASVAILGKNRFNPPNPKPKKATVQTVLVREGKPLGRGIDWWWLLLAVIVGLVMVLIMFYVLYKCGFFKRSSRDDLSELQKDAQSASPILATHHSPINNMVDVDDNDNSATFHDSKV